ncbi:MAG: translation initiation factor IF-2 [Verrucomicrobiales bacterium]|jgi:translation initiation factor IF-2
MAESKPPSKKKTAAKKAAKKSTSRKAASKSVAKKKVAKKAAKKTATKKSAAKALDSGAKNVDSKKKKVATAKNEVKVPASEAAVADGNQQMTGAADSSAKTGSEPEVPAQAAPAAPVIAATPEPTNSTQDSNLTTIAETQELEGVESPAVDSQTPPATAKPESAAPKREVLSLIDEQPKRRRRKKKDIDAEEAAMAAQAAQAKVEPVNTEPAKKSLDVQKKEALSLFEEAEKRESRPKRTRVLTETTIADATAAGVLPPISRLRAEQDGTLPPPRVEPAPTLVVDADADADVSEDEGGVKMLEEGDPRLINIKPPIIVKELAERMDLKPFKLIQDLMELDIFANPNQSIEPDVAEQLCEKHGFVFWKEKREKGRGVHKVEEVIEEPPAPVEEPEDELKVRPPIVTFMGHVDHGKTSLMDALRKSRVASGEAGGITQHVGAYAVDHNGQALTFLDTPGHAAFSRMRARGAGVTDIVVLVVAADDGFMPQTIEALSHARAAGVKIIVAINKCDLPAADPMRVMTHMQENDLAPEDWGGSTSAVQVSAKAGTGLDDLLEIILLEAELLELKANPDAPARGMVIESRQQPGRGPTATVIPQNGTLRVGVPFICGPFSGKIKSLTNDSGQSVKSAGPATPVEVVGFSGMPNVGDEVVEMDSEKSAKKLSGERVEELRKEKLASQQKSRLDSLWDSFESGAKRLAIVLKTDVQGSVEAIIGALEEIDTDKVDVVFLHSAAGPISESDVLLASASDAIIIGFNTKVESNAVKVARREGAEIKLFSVIYELIDQVKNAMLGLLDPESREHVVGHAVVKQVFKLTRGIVAGCQVTDGRVTRSARARILRGGQPVYDGGFSTLRRFKDDVAEVRNGLECGIRLGDYKEYEEDDIIECYELEKIDQTL